MNNYDFIEVIGEGTYGVVYKCCDKRTGRIVAVKQFKNFQTNDYIRCTMLRELRVEQLLKGEPNVTQLLETFKQKSRLYLVMEYIPRSLLDVLDEHPAGIPEEPLAMLLYTLLLGIQSCHRNGIIHRDVKPENILVRNDGTASLCDFGFCRPAPQQTSSTTTTATNGAHSGTEGGSSNKKVRGPSSPKGSLTAAANPTTTSSALSSSPATAGHAPTTAATAFLSELVLADHRGVMTDYVATRWYRSPEMLLGLPSYGYAVDMWAVGAIMAEAIDGEPLLPGKTELEQLSLVQTRIGEFPAAYEAAVRKRNGGMLHLRTANPLAKQQQPQQRNTRVRLSLHSSNSSSSDAESGVGGGDDATTISSYLSMRYGGRLRKLGMHLLSRLLCIDGDDRITVEEALAHPYFDVVRHDPRLVATPADASAAPMKDETSDDAEDAPVAAAAAEEEEEEEDVLGLSEALPELTPAICVPVTPLAPTCITVSPEKIFAAADGSSSAAGSSRRFLRAVEDSSALNEPPREASLHSVGASLVRPSPSQSPGMPHLSNAALPPLDMPSVSTTALNDDRAGGPFTDGCSPPPRPVQQGTTTTTAAVPEHTAQQRRHAASEGASQPTPATTSALSKSEQRVATLLFKTKKNRAALNNIAIGQHRAAHDDDSGTPTAAAAAAAGSPGSLLGGGNALSFSGRPAYARGGNGAAAAGVGGLAPLRRLRSGDNAAPLTSAVDSEEERATPPLDHRHPSPPLSLPGAAAESVPEAEEVAAKARHPSAHEHDTSLFKKGNADVKKKGANTANGEDAAACMSAPRSGGNGGGDDKQPAGEGEARKRTNSYSTHSSRPEEHATPLDSRSRREAKKAVRPSVRPTQKTNAAAHDESTASTPLRSDTSPRQGDNTRAAGAAEGRSAKKKRSTSQPRRQPAQRAAAPATSSVSARATATSSHPVTGPSPAAGGAAVSAARARAPLKASRRRASPGDVRTSTTAAKTTTAAAAGASTPAPKTAAGASRFATPKLPRVVKPLLPRERMTLLKEIESLGCPAEVPLAVEVMLPVRASPSRPAEDDRDAPETSISGNGTRKDTQAARSRSTASASSSSSSSASGSPSAPDPIDMLGASQSQLSADGDELFVEDLDSDLVSRSPLLSEASGQGDSLPQPPPWPALSLTEENTAAPTDSTASTNAHGRPPRMDFGYPVNASSSHHNTINNSSNSSRAPPSLFFRPSRNAPAPLKLAAIHMTQSSASAQPPSLLGGSDAAAAAASLTDGVSSPSAHHGSASLNGVSQPQTSSCVSPLYGRRPTPTLLRHPPAKAVTPLPSPSSSALDASPGLRGGVGLQALHASTAQLPSRAHETSHMPVVSSLPFHKIGCGYLNSGASEASPKLSSQVAVAPLPEDCVREAGQPVHQRRLSANHLSLSVSEEFHTSSGAAAAFGRRSQERLPHIMANALRSSPLPPPAALDEVETELLVDTPPARRPPPPEEWETPKRQESGATSVIPSPSPVYSTATTNTTAAAVSKGGTTRETSAITPPRSVSRDNASVPRYDGSSSGRASSAMDRTQRSRASAERKSTVEGDEHELAGGAQTVSFPLHSMEDPFVAVEEAPVPSSDVPRTRHAPQPVLGGVWVNVDPLRGAHGLHTGSSRKKGRLIL